MSIYEAAEGGGEGGGEAASGGGGSGLSESLSTGAAKGAPLGERLSALTAPLEPLATKVGVSTNAAALALAVLVAVIVGAATGAFGGGLFGPKTVTVGRFVAVEAVMSQIDAERYCHKTLDHGKSLASIHTEADQAAAVQACGQLDLARTWDGTDNDGKPSGCWIGLTDNEEMPDSWAVEGQFEWTDGSPVDFSRWGTGEPSNSLHGGQGQAASGEDGVTLTWVTSSHGDGWWNDAHDTGYTSETGCSSCSDKQNKKARGNYFVCQTDFPPVESVNKAASRVWREKVTEDRFVAVGRVMPQTAAKTYCEGQGWTLASIHSTTDQKHAVHACSKLNLATTWTTDVVADDGETVLKKASGFAQGCWIGLSDSEQIQPIGSGITSEGKFVWADGTTVDYAAWTYPEPSNGWENDGLSDGEDHVMLNWVNPIEQRGGWNDIPDNGLVGTAQHIAPDWMSKGYYPLCQTRPPAVYDHNAHMSWEVETEQQFTDPITRQSAYYIAVGRVLPQTVSQQLCEGPPFNGHLASVHSPDEQTMLENLCQTLSLSHTWDMMDHRGFANSCWIGLTDNEDHQSMGANLGVSEGRFGWTDRSPVDYTNWQPGEPSNNVRTGDGASGEDAVTITFVGSFDGKWNDIHDIGYNRKTGCTTCAQDEEAVWGSYPICKAGPSYRPRGGYGR